MLFVNQRTVYKNTELKIISKKMQTGILSLRMSDQWQLLKNETNELTVKKGIKIFCNSNE